MCRLGVFLLGRFLLTLDGRPLEAHHAAARLIAYLGLSYGRLVSRARVAGTLWPDAEEARARANLSTVLWRLRRNLSAHGFSRDPVRVVADSMGLDPDLVEVDVVQFRLSSFGHETMAVSLESLSRAGGALRLYRGDLLEDWDVEWCLVEREELRRRYLHTLKVLAEGFERRGRYDLALQYAERAVAADPLNEPAHRALMRILHRTGNTSAAVAQFNRLASLVRDELGVEPDRETLALANEIRSPWRAKRPGDQEQSGHAPLIRPDMVPLVGRDEERQQVGALLASAWEGRGGGILILGDAGIGKSRLVDWAREEWAARGGAMAQGRCVEFNEPVPYQPIFDALSSCAEGMDLREVARLGGDALGPLTDESTPRVATGEVDGASSLLPGRLRFFSRLRMHFEDLSRRRPLLVAVEDLQWADEGTVDFLGYLLDRARMARLAVLVTSRLEFPGPHGRSSADRIGRYCIATLRLRPLSDPESAAFMQWLMEGRQMPSSLTAWIHREAEGNPLFIIETLKSILQREDARRAAEGCGDPIGREIVSVYDAGARTPEGVRSVVQQRLSLLGPEALRIAEIASVLGRSVDEELLRLTSGFRENRLARAVGQLLRSGILEREGSGYRFTHDKIRAVCYENLPPGRLRALHGRAAGSLAGVAGVPAHLLAWHRDCAGQWAIAAESWERAGDEARDVYAYEEALRAFRRSIYCVRRDETRDTVGKDETEIGLLVKIDEVLAMLGRPTDRADVLERLGRLCGRDPGGRRRALWMVRVAMLEEHVGNFTRAASLARSAWSLARRDGDDNLAFEALRVLALALTRGGRHKRALLVTRLILKKVGTAKSALVAATLREAAGVHIQLGDHQMASRLLERAKGISLELGLTMEYHFAVAMQAIRDRLVGNLEGCRSGLLAGLDHATRIRDPISTARISFQLGALDALEGRIGEALARLRAAKIASRRTGYTRTLVSCLNEVANSVGRQLGNYGWAWSASSHAIDLARKADMRLALALCRDSQAHLLIDQGRWGEARALLDELLREFEETGHQGDPYGPHLDSLVKHGIVLSETGDLPGALRELERAREVLMRSGERLQLPDTLTYLALTHARLGDEDRAIATSEEAIRLLAEIGHANLQPQRIYWHHYLILETFGRTPRLPFLERAVTFIEAQGATVSRAQRRRLREAVSLNREILAAWDRHRSDGAPDRAVEAVPTPRAPAVGTLTARESPR